MKKIAMGTGDWILVCDGRKALVLVNKGDEKFPNLQILNTFEQPSSSTHELGADAPGRVHQSQGVARSAVRQTDWHDAAEKRFLESVANWIAEAIASPTAPGAIFVIASPRALGMIREAYSPALRKKIKAEIGKDYVTLPIHELEKRITADLENVNHH
ncbi:MAG: host attachment protein [Pseudorhodoplanes sp.]|nr:host attachment protein [Pseudorhodoplanes sp.]